MSLYCVFRHLKRSDCR